MLLIRFSSWQRKKPEGSEVLKVGGRNTPHTTCLTDEERAAAMPTLLERITVNRFIENDGPGKQADWNCDLLKLIVLFHTQR